MPCAVQGSEKSTPRRAVGASIPQTPPTTGWCRRSWSFRAMPTKSVPRWTSLAEKASRSRLAAPAHPSPGTLWVPGSFSTSRGT